MAHATVPVRSLTRRAPGSTRYQGLNSGQDAQFYPEVFRQAPGRRPRSQGNAVSCRKRGRSFERDEGP